MELSTTVVVLFASIVMVPAVINLPTEDATEVITRYALSFELLATTKGSISRRVYTRLSELQGCDCNDDECYSLKKDLDHCD